MNYKKLYKLNDDILFRECSLWIDASVRDIMTPIRSSGDCTNYHTTEKEFAPVYNCNQEGFHFHCAKHKEVEFDVDEDEDGWFLTCPHCRNHIPIKSIHDLVCQCIRLKNREIFKDAQLIRLDDWYVPEIKKKEDIGTEYFLHTDVKKDKDGDTIVVIYVGHKGSKEKAQIFVKPEKLQLASDYKDLDPAKVLAKIEVTLRDRILLQEFD